MRLRDIVFLTGLVAGEADVFSNFKSIEDKVVENICPPVPEYGVISHDRLQWQNLGEGLEFSRTGVYRDSQLVDVIAAVKVDPNYNEIKIVSGFNSRDNTCILRDIEEWQRETNATVVVNGAQYMADPWGMPCGLIIENGIPKGPKKNKMVRGMLIAEPTKDGLPKADILDFSYDRLEDSGQYSEGMQHWPILLDRFGKIGVKKTDWQANRTVVTKDREGYIVFLTTEKGFFTLYNFGRFLRDEGKEYNTHTAMNLDGGYEAEMCVRTPLLNYITFGQFETYGPNENVSIAGARCKIPTVITISPRVNEN